jgi:hypothetical protein
MKALVCSPIGHILLVLHSHLTLTVHLRRWLVCARMISNWKGERDERWMKLETFTWNMRVRCGSTAAKVKDKQTR